jgi:hypothetical protein
MRFRACEGRVEGLDLLACVLPAELPAACGAHLFKSQRRQALRPANPMA